MGGSKVNAWEECQMRQDVPMDQEVSRKGDVELAKTTRHSSRLKNQELNHLLAADKVEALKKKKKNLEGNSLNTHNSFSILGEDELILRSNKMGID